MRSNFKILFNYGGDGGSGDGEERGAGMKNFGKILEGYEIPYGIFFWGGM